MGEVRCECDHLTDFIVVKAPTSWDEFMQSALEGFEVNVFSWDQATSCWAKPRWTFVQPLVLVLGYISPTSPLHLPYISPTSPLHLPCISPTSSLHLPYISPTSPPTLRG